MGYWNLLRFANSLQATIPVVIWAVVIFIMAWPDLYSSHQVPARVQSIYLAIAMSMLAVVGSLCILSDRSSRQEECIQKLEDELDRLRKWIQD